MMYRKRLVHAPGSDGSECHAVTLVELETGALLCAWYAGTSARSRETAIYGAALPPDAEDWIPYGTLTDMPSLSAGNPVLFLDGGGRLWLFYVTLFGDRWDTCQVRYTHSHDAGKTWSTPTILHADWGWMTGSKPLLRPDGTILLPLYSVQGLAFVMRSEDGGKAWRPSSRIETEPGVIQPTLAPLNDGRLLMYLRRKAPHDEVLWQATSDDGGCTWSPPVRTRLPDPKARIDLARLSDGRLALALKDTKQGAAPLTLALSEDEGAAWPCRRNVETDAGEYASPALIQSRDGLLHLVYTCQRTQIAHITCDIEWIREHDG
jgi:predicted neuraminidase